MDIKIVDELTGEEIKNDQSTIDNPSELLAVNQIEIQEVAKLFDLKPSEIGLFKDKLGLLVQYAKTLTKSTSIENIQWAIRKLGKDVGTPPLGEKSVNYLSKYAYLTLEKSRMERLADGNN